MSDKIEMIKEKMHTFFYIKIKIFFFVKTIFKKEEN